MIKTCNLTAGITLLLLLVSVPNAASARAFGNAVIYPAGSIPHGLAVADFNSDGNLDIAVANAESNDVSILLGVGDGTFLPPTSYPVGIGPEGITVSCETLTIESPVDLAVTNNIENTVSILIGNGDGTFQPAVTYDLGSGTIPTGIVGSVDFNNDGKCDLAVANGGGGTNGNGNLAIFLGDGDGTFQPAANYDTLGVQPTAIASGDFNNDLNPDLAVTDVLSADVTVFLNDGSGAFVAAAAYTVGSGPSGLTIYNSGDLVATAKSGNISVLEGNGDGTFTNVHNYRLSGYPFGITQGLINGDSTPDVVVTDESGLNVSVLLGRVAPKNKFRPPATFSACGSPHSVVAYDFNHDNKTDLAVACSNGVGILLNTSP